MNEYLKLGIAVAVVGAVFGFLWQRGYLVRLGNYVHETREELRKCTWPSREELKGSTVVVIISTVLLGAFTVGVDQVVGFIITRVLTF